MTTITSKTTMSNTNNDCNDKHKEDYDVNGENNVDKDENNVAFDYSNSNNNIIYNCSTNKENKNSNEGSDY